MAPKVPLAKLKDQLNDQLQKEKLKDALATYVQLEAGEPSEPRWPHRRGDLLLRMKLSVEAVSAYERAVDVYVKQGFAARGAALAKVILGLDPTRTDVLARIDGQAVRDMRNLHATASATSAAPATAPDRAPTAPNPPPATPRTSLVDEVIEGAQQRNRASFVFEAPILEPDFRAADDEIRFVDMAPRNTLELDITEIDFEDPSEEVAFILEEDVPPISALVAMPSVPLFADIRQEALTGMLELADLVELEDGQLLVREGDPADSLFILAEGQAEVRLAGGTTLPLAEGEIVGETCLFAGLQRRADVFARGNLRALKLDRASLEVLINRWPELGGILYELLTRRLVQNLLRNSEIFTAFDPATRVEVGKLFEVRRASPKTVLVAADKRADGMYVPLLGTLEARFPDGRVMDVPTGTLLGEQSLLSQMPAQSTIMTITEGVLLRLPKSRFNELASLYPLVLAHLADLAARGSFEDQAVGRL